MREACGAAAVTAGESARDSAATKLIGLAKQCELFHDVAREGAFDSSRAEEIEAKLGRDEPQRNHMEK